MPPAGRLQLNILYQIDKYIIIIKCCPSFILSGTSCISFLSWNVLLYVHSIAVHVQIQIQKTKMSGACQSNGVEITV